MGMFDFLSGSGGNTDTSTVTAGSGGGGISGLLTNPNFIKMLGDVGAGLSSEGSIGKAVGTAVSGMARQQANQRAAKPLMQKILDLNNENPTPVGQQGANRITTKIDRTADGTKVTHSFDEPSAANLNSYGTTVPPEAISNNIIAGDSNTDTTGNAGVDGSINSPTKFYSGPAGVSGANSDLGSSAGITGEARPFLAGLLAR
jgi:hypothetical protein